MRRISTNGVQIFLLASSFQYSLRINFIDRKLGNGQKCPLGSTPKMQFASRRDTFTDAHEFSFEIDERELYASSESSGIRAKKDFNDPSKTLTFLPLSERYRQGSTRAISR